MLEHFDSWIRGVGPVGYLILGLAALIEYVFPPFPGDTVLVLGGVYAVRGERPWPWVLLVVTLGSVIGAALNYGVGRELGRRFERHPQATFLGLSHVRVHELEARMRHRGDLFL